MTGRTRPIVLSVLIFAINVFICRELFGIEFLDTLSSNDGLFIAVSRFYKEHGTGGGWFPWLNAGMPIENVYQPLLPALSAFVSTLVGWPIGRAMHFVLALFYCCGPVTLFWFAYEWSESAAIAFVAALAYSVTSPAEILVPILRVHFERQWGALRLYNLIHYAEDPHNVALTLVPVALMFVRRAAMRANAFRIALAVVACSCVVLSNAFGAVDLAIGCLCIVLALNRGWGVVAAIGVAAYLWISPWLPPSLIDKMRRDQWGARGLFTSGVRSLLSAVTVLAVFVLLWWAGRRLRSAFERFSILFAFWMCVIPLGFFLLGVTLVPQGSRYQLEMEMGLCLLFACLVAHIRWRVAAMAALVLGGVWQTILFRHFASTLIQPVDMAQTIEYKSDIWMARNLPPGRRMVSGDGEYYYNVFSDTPEMSGAHEPTAPNFEQLIAIFTIFTGQNAGGRDAEYSLLWLKAFGNEVIYVPGEKSRENYHPIVRPHKFDGILPVLWHEEDDTVYGVPLRSTSLAHVIPKNAVVARAPVHGLDVDPLRPYVAALEDSSLPVADMKWEGTARAMIHATAGPSQVISIQENYAPGWRAWVADRRVRIVKDGIGLMVVNPDCNGMCEVRMEYGPTEEAWICRALSGLVTILAIGCVGWRRSKR